MWHTKDKISKMLWQILIKEGAQKYMISEKSHSSPLRQPGNCSLPPTATRVESSSALQGSFIFCAEQLAETDPYQNRIPLRRCICLWGEFVSNDFCSLAPFIKTGKAHTWASALHAKTDLFSSVMCCWRRTPVPVQAVVKIKRGRKIGLLLVRGGVAKLDTWRGRLLNYPQPTQSVNLISEEKT